ncbi:MAG TPA: hypothetical protein PKN48_12790 [Bacteroidales bacterium]|nr:hypothetical protein [Bacteroidales bacterium]
MVIRLTLTIIIAFFYSIVSAQHTDAAKLNAAEQQKWLKKTASEMVQFHPDSSALPLIPRITETDDYYQITYRLTGKGWIKLANGEWIYMISSSAHTNPEVGDITLGMDDKKNFYTNKSHVCGGIVHFQCLKKSEIKAPADFFKNFEGDTDNVPWAPVNIKLKKQK